jgi:hypothetical protein
MVLYWNCWTRNYSAKEDGFIIHAFAEDIDKPIGARVSGRTLCGIRWFDSGIMRIPDEVEPGCLKCRGKLRTLGVELSF